MSNKVQDALEAREARKKKELQDKKDKVSLALESRKTRMSSNAQSALQDIYSKLNTEIDTANKLVGTTWGVGAQGDALESTRESRVNIKNLQRELEAYKSYVDEDEYKSLSTVINQLNQSYDSYLSDSEIREMFDSEDSYNRYVAERELLKSDDFQEYSQKGREVANPAWDDTKAPLDIFGWKPFGEGETISNMVTFAEANQGKVSGESAEALRGGGQSSERSQLLNLINLYMKEDEKDIYNYYIGKGEVDKANEYLNNLSDVLRYRQAEGITAQVDDSETLAMLFAAAAGLDQFASGIRNIDNFFTGAEADPTSATQYASSMIREKLDGGWGVAYDAISTTANMLPSVLVSAIPVVGKPLGLATMGTSVIGNAYAEMKNLGYDDWQSRAYAMSVGAAEMFLQSALGGITKLGGKYSASAAVSKFVSKVDNALAKVAIKLGGNMISEGFEEGIQTALEPLLKELWTGEDFEGAEWDEIFYSFFLGALSSGMMEGVPTIYSTAKSNIGAKKIYGDGKDLVAEGLEIGGDAGALAEKYQKNRIDKSKKLTGSQINHLIAANEQAMKTNDTGKIKSAAEARLTELGEKGNVSALADVITKHRSGGKLTRAEKQMLRESTYGRRVSNEANPDYIKSGGYSSEWATKIGTDRINDDVYNPAPQGKTLTPGDIKLKEFASAGEPPETKFEVSESGETTVGGEKVNIKEIASIKDGEITLRLDNGETVNANEVEFSSNDEGLLYESAIDMGLNAATANAFVKGFEPGDGLSIQEYVLGFREAYNYGSYSIPMQEMSRDGLSFVLPEVKKSLAYNLGKTDAKYKITEKQNKVTEAKEAPKTDKTSKAKGKLYNTIKPTNERQRASLKALGVLADALGINIHIFESETDAKGRRIGKNGWYDPKTGDIGIDLYAGQNGESTMLFTASHELTHFIRDWSPAKFKVFADFLLEQYGEKRVSVSDLVRKQIEKAKKRGRTISYDVAYGEVVADACEMMLTDSNAIEVLAKLKAKDKSLWHKIKDFISNLVARITKAYEGMNPGTEEANYVKEMKDAAERLQALWTEALVDAGENYNASIGSRNLEDFADAKNENGEPLFQYRAMEADEDIYREMLQKWGKMSSVQIDNLFTTIDNAMELIKDNLKILDYAWEADIDDRAFSPVKANSDNLYKVSLDFSTLCRKRILQQTVATQLQDALNKPLSREEGIAIRDALIALQEEGRKIEVACALCYVESARMKSPKQIKRFMEDKEQVIKEFFAGKSGGSIKEKIKQAEVDAREKLHKEHPSGIKGKDGETMLDPRNAALGKLPKQYADAIRLAKKTARESYKPTAEEQKLIDVAKRMTVSDFTSPEGLENLAKNYPSLFDAYASFIVNATHSKGIENDTWWRAGDSKNIGDVLIANMNKENGLRSQSWSDFQVIHILDYIASTIELATRNTKEQAYSKVPDYVELMGLTGVMINMSLIPTATFNGSLEYDSVEGIEYRRALELRDKYHATAGTICIGVDDVQIKMLLADTTIDYVIPFHRSGMAAHIRKAMHIPTWSECQDYQSETKLSKSEAEKQAKKYGVKLLDAKDPNYQVGTNFSDWFDLKEAQQIAKMENANPSDKAKQKKYGVMYGGYMAMQNAANNYLKLCAERGLSPKFSHEKADFTAEDNYWKLLIDRKMVDNVTGEVIEQQNIKPIFSEGEVMRILNDELARYPGVKADQEYAIRKVTEKMLSGEVKGGMSAEAIAKVMKKPVDNVTNINILASSEDMLLSDRDSEGNTLSKEQQEYFKDSKVRDVNDNLIVCYHGTNVKRKFYRFRTKGSPAWFTPSIGYANAFARGGERRAVYKVYLNITNPLWLGDIDGVATEDNLKHLSALSKIDVATLKEILLDEKGEHIWVITNSRKFKELVKKQGYDGFTAREGGVTSWATFDAEQAKLVDNEYPSSDPDIRYSDREIQPVTETEYETLKKHFGVTGNFRVAGYLLTDGKLLDFSGKHWGDSTSRSRQVDHRDVQEVLSRGNNGIDDMVDMIGSGNIRLMPEIGGINLAVYPNEKQRRVLSVYIKQMLATEGQVIIGYDTVGGDTVHSRVYGKYSSSSQILSDIRNYFNGARRSELMDFHTSFSDRDSDSFSTRSLLAGALESVAENDIEKSKLKQYKEKIALIESEQKKLSEIRAKAKELRFTKGRTPSETKQMRDLDFEANQIANRINTYDKQLLNLESTKALKNVLEREKQILRKRLEQKGKEALNAYKERAAETVRELMTRNTESRKKAIEGRHKTEMRNKIKDIVSDLNKLLLNPTKEQHVPIGLQGVVADALDAINMDTMNAEERVAYYNELIAKAKDPDEIATLTKKRDFFAYRDMNFKEKITALKNAYAEFKESDDPLIRNAHNDAIEELIKNTADAVGNKSLKDMSLEQLEAVYDMYKALRATVRNANKMFKEGRQETVTDNSEAVKTEVREVGGHKDRIHKVTKWLKTQGWNMLKPVYAMKMIGSDTFKKLYDNVRAGEDTWAVDVSEAKEFYQEKAKKYNYKSWDFKAQHSFKDSVGNDFSLSLEQIMSLYAYSKREQADKHLEVGGFVFDDVIEVTEKNKLGLPVKYEVNDANPYRLKREDLGTVIAALTEEQKSFIDEMQTYLSDVMGAKGNEVSLALYDIKLYKEKNYFPLKTAKHFREFDPEKNGTPKIKNSGFSKKTVPQAGNPIVLSNFMDVWATHVNDMSMYHAFVLPLEDFMRVYNYSSTAGGYDSVQQAIKNAYGSGANQYIETLMNDLNGGARVDPTAGIMNKMIGLSKKAAVLASASVVVQQPSAIFRAMALVDAKYFVGKPSATRHKNTWAEVKKYAPVAIIKEMGYFDTGMGQSTVEWLKGNKSIKDKVDDALSKAPALADELTWCAIWKAVKRETLAKNKNLDPNSEEFLKKCGERFTEVVTETQVYDSVLARSGMMRSKDTGMKMATAFMAEPTTSLNMIINAIVQGKRGNKRLVAKAVSAVAVATIVNSALVALVYAARDDDEDETYLEKYIGSITSELIDGFNILTYIPFVKDIWSIFQGYDVERSDMSLISDLWQSFENLFGDGTAYDKVSGVAGALASVLGVPLKNILRDAEGTYNFFKTITSGTPTTGAGIRDTIVESLKDAIPLWGRFSESKSTSDKLYEAIMSGDADQIERLKSQYDSQDKIDSAIKTGLRENDPRIKEAAQARYDGNIAEYKRIAKEIIAEGNFSQDIVVGAINAAVNAIKKGETTETEQTEDKDEATSIYKASDLNAAFESGDNTMALEIIEDLVKTKVANGKTEKEAKSSVRSSMTSYWKPLYLQAYKSGNSAEMQRIRKILYASGLYGNGNEVVKTVQGWLKD